MVSKNVELVQGVLSSLVEVSKELVVMDFGCGKGVFAEYLKDLGHEYVGVDIDKDSFSVQRLPKGKSQETVVMSVVSKEG